MLALLMIIPPRSPRYLQVFCTYNKSHFLLLFCLLHHLKHSLRLTLPFKRNLFVIYIILRSLEFIHLTPAYTIVEFLLVTVKMSKVYVLVHNLGMLHDSLYYEKCVAYSWDSE